jgi:hypothetical protein
MTQQGRVLDASAVKNFYSQLLHLLEFTRDMDRNIWESRFAEGKNHIHYVFDENVFEFFVGARNQVSKDDNSTIFEDKRKYSAVFHLVHWRDDPANRRQEERWTRINRQTAIVTAEYVLGGDLPGQYERRLYLTEWHAKELMHRFALLEAHFRTKADKSERAASERIQRNIENIIKVTSDPELAVDELFKQAFIPPQDFDTIRNDVHRKLCGCTHLGGKLDRRRSRRASAADSPHLFQGDCGAVFSPPDAVTETQCGGPAGDSRRGPSMAEAHPRRGEREANPYRSAPQFTAPRSRRVVVGLCAMDS